MIVPGNGAKGAVSWKLASYTGLKPLICIPQKFLAIFAPVRRTVILIILASMVLHCASRTGLLTYLYQQRLQIAYSLGFIDEIPIAVCSSDYDFRQEFIVHQTDENRAASHQTLPMASEIKLFFVTQLIHITDTNGIAVVKSSRPDVTRPLTGCRDSVFHPPAVRA